MEQSTVKKLYRSRSNRYIAGVCGGLGEFFGIDPLVIRILFVLAALFHGFGLLVYLAMAIFVPLEPSPVSAGINPDPISDNEGTKEKMESFINTARTKAENLAGEMKDERGWFNHPRNLIGLIILLVGIIALLNQFFPYSWFSWNYFWPVIIIAVGLIIIARK